MKRTHTSPKRQQGSCDSSPKRQRGSALDPARGGHPRWRCGLVCVALLLAAGARAEEGKYPSGVTWIEPAGIAGSLVIHGGGPLPDAVRDKFLELAGGKQARIIVIPTASGEADSDEPSTRERLLQPWKSQGAADVQILHTRSKETANEPTFVDPLKLATGVWLGGGDQTKIADAFLGTAVERELTALLARGGVVGGTSAGAAIQSKTMIASGQSEPRMGTGFDLLPGAIIDQHFTARKRQDRLRKALADHPGHVGFGIDEGTALVVRGRRLSVLGQGGVSVYLAACSSRPVREQVLRDGESHDLTMLRRAALDRSLAAFPPRDLPPPRLESGSLVIVGGGGLPKEVVARFVELAGGPNAPIVVLPTAVEPTGGDNATAGRFLERAGAKHVTILSQRTRAEVESAEFAAALSEAKGVWFGGGRQWRFIDAYAGTRTERLLHDLLRRGGVIGGSSAGASIQAQYLVRGSVLGNADMMAEGYERGLALLPGTAIDQHFTQRKRQADLAAVVERFPQLLGIGLDEATAIVVQGKTAEVLGAGQAHFLAGEKAITLTAGERLDLVERMAAPAPAAP